MAEFELREASTGAVLRVATPSRPDIVGPSLRFSAANRAAELSGVEVGRDDVVALIGSLQRWVDETASPPVTPREFGQLPGLQMADNWGDTL